MHKSSFVLGAVSALLLVFVAAVVTRYAYAADRNTRGVTVAFSGGGVVFFPQCDYGELVKPQARGDSPKSWNDCGGGTESLGRIDLSQAVAICGGNCR